MTESETIMIRVKISSRTVLFMESLHSEKNNEIGYSGAE